MHFIRIRTAIVTVIVATTTCCLAQAQSCHNSVESVRRLVGIFENCQFTAIITSDDVRVRDYDYRSRINVAAWLCRGAALIRWTNNVKISDNGKRVGRGLSSDEKTESEEWRWIAGEPWLRFGVRVTDSSGWPGNPLGEEVAQIAGPGVAFAHDYGAWSVVWRDKLIGEFIYGLDLDPGMKFEDLVTDDGRLGFNQKSVEEDLRDDTSSCTHSFRSASYGTCDVTVARIGDSWMPTRFVLNRTGHDRLTAPDPVTGRCQSSIDGECILVSDLPPGRTKADPSLDRLETTYTITYDPLPTSIEKHEVQFYRGQKYTSSWKLVFSTLRLGNVDPSVINTAALCVRDGTRIFTTDQTKNRIRSEFRSGKVAKAIDLTSINIAESARFSTSRRVALVVTSIVVVALAILLIYRRAAFR